MTIPAFLQPKSILAQLRSDAGGESVTRKWGVTAPALLEGCDRKVVGYLRHPGYMQGYRSDAIFELEESVYVLPDTGKRYVSHSLYESAVNLPPGCYRDTCSELRTYKVPGDNCLGNSVILSSKDHLTDFIRSPERWEEVKMQFVAA